MAENSMQKAIELVTKATDEDTKKNYNDALRLYTNACDYFMHAMKYECQGEKQREIIRTRVTEYMNRAERIKEFLKTGKKAKPMKDDTNSKDKDSGSSEEDDENSKFQKAMNKSIIVEKPNIKWTDVAGLEGAKEALQNAIILPVKFPHMFQGERVPWGGVLLYGPPGTGKSFIAKAVATEANNSTFFSVSSSDLVSKWLGESEKLVRQLFEMARAKKPSIIFIDEVDSLCSARSDNESESARRIKTEFLVQMDGVGKDQTGVLVLGATNMPWALDAGMRRRFEKRIYIPLPDLMARRTMLQKMIGKIRTSMTSKDISDLAEKTSGYSGADIKTTVREALLRPLQKLTHATHFKKVRGPSVEDPNVMVDDMLTPCSPGERGAIEASCNDLPPNKVIEPAVSLNDMLQALQNTKPSVSSKDLEKLEEFTREFGQEF